MLTGDLLKVLPIPLEHRIDPVFEAIGHAIDVRQNLTVLLVYGFHTRGKILFPFNPLRHTLSIRPSVPPTSSNTHAAVSITKRRVRRHRSRPVDQGEAVLHAARRSVRQYAIRIRENQR